MPEEVHTPLSIGVISDTHGLLRPEVRDIFEGVSLILHAGDVGGVDILRSLEAISPVTAVSGNMDRGMISTFLNEEETIVHRGYTFHLLHDLVRLSINPAASGVHMVISGHTHLPEFTSKSGVLYLNPGSAGPERPGKPISLARVTARGGSLSAKHYYL